MQDHRFEVSAEMRKRIAIVANTGWYLWNFRRNLICRLMALGHDVVAISPADAYVERLVTMGCRHIELPIDNKGSNPVRDLTTAVRIFRIYRALRPDVTLQNTIKPNIYGSFAAATLGIPVINTVTGLGTAFLRPGIRLELVIWLYRLSQTRAFKVFFQNREDLAFFREKRIIANDSGNYIPGSGVDLSRFRFSSPRDAGGDMVFLLVGRLLRDKGVVEFVQAARLVRQQFPRVRFQLLGFLDADNASAIGEADVSAWGREGIVEYLGATDDVVPFIQAADCVVLPSYREGLPKVLIEAAALGTPILATDVVGCRDAVVDGVNGLLCRAADAEDLALKIRRMIELPFSERCEFARRGREMVEARYDEELVIVKYLGAIRKAVALVE